MLKGLIFLLSFHFTALAFADLKDLSCHLSLYQLGRGNSTPLEQEAEWMLSLKGYQVEHKDNRDFNSAILNPLEMFGSFKAGDVSLLGDSDCRSENFKGFGQRYTCAYEMNLVTVSATGELVTFASVAAHARDVGSVDEFYSSIRAQLQALPICQ